MRFSVVRKKKMSRERNVLIGLLTVVCLLQFDVMAGVIVRPCPTKCHCSRQTVSWSSAINLIINCNNRPGIDPHQLYKQIDSYLINNDVNNRLIINRSPLSHLPQSLCRLTNLTFLDISNNRLADLPNNCFIDFDQIITLKADFNNITYLKNGVFRGMVKLYKLNLSHNQIDDLVNGVFNSTKNLMEIDLSNNKITALPNGIFGGIRLIGILDLSNNKIAALPSGIFGGVSLVYLDLSHNQIAELPRYIFDNMVRLKYLNLHDNKITAISNGVFDSMGPLKYLNLLNLSSNEIAELPDEVFHGMGQLFKLDLSGNKLASIGRQAFSSESNMTTRIYYLYLHDNQLTSMQPWWHDVNITATRMSIGFNPWDCSCDNEWMTGWLNSTANRIDDLENVLCDTPPRLHGMIIIHMSDEDFCVDPAAEAAKRAWTISMSSVAGVVIVLLSVGIIVYRLRVKLYTRFKFHPFDRDECLGEDMDYDVFFCCSSEDHEPEGSRILESVEAKGYRVCYHYRDFMPGLITANIEASVTRSKRTLCLLTSNFVRRFEKCLLFWYHWLVYFAFA